MAMKFSFVPRTHYLSPRGMTLVEMLVALVVTLIMMGAVITVFGFIGETVTDSRSIIETNDRLRSAAHLLREDLGSVTARMMPPLRPESGLGYFEIIEGAERDAFDRSGNLKSTTVQGDTDDALFFTVRSGGEPYRGKNANNAVPFESPTAEVAWYLRDTPNQSPNTNPKTFVLCRKLMLIVGEAPNFPALNTAFYANYDVSARRTSATNATPVANTLGDLTKRENRFARQVAFPYELDTSTTSPLQLFEVSGSGRTGEDVVLTNVLGFDVQVWDQDAPLKKLPNHDKILTPSDPPYGGQQAVDYPPTNTVRGGYVDLGMFNGRSGFSNATGQTFRNAPHRKSGLNLSQVGYTYDTWSFHYEHDGVRQQTAQFSTGVNNNTVDAGTNGIDDNPMQSPGIDDISERETMPPYPLPLRGVRVTIRVYEPSSRQVREVTLVESFVPE
jgi:prepilin-type N-terminal cleavage/methylation domain-containing protein